MTTATNDAFFDEYTSSNAILTYSRGTAGLGISYLLDHDYKDIYLQALALLPTGVVEQGIRVLEFGCGAGMNLLHLLGLLRREGINIVSALGTDFSPVLIETARAEANNCLDAREREKVQFYVAKNERPKIPDMRKIPNRRPAHVHSDAVVLERLKVLDLASKCVKESEHCVSVART